MKSVKVVIVTVLMLIALMQILFCKNFMWEVQGGKNKAYLLGSIHTMPKDVYPLDEKIESAFQESDKLVVEVNTNKLDTKEITNYVRKYAIYQDSTNLKILLPKDIYQVVNEKVMELGFKDDDIKAYKPWFVSINLSLGALQKIDVEAGLGIDVHFMAKAEEREMAILELESALSQFKVLSSMDDEVQKDILVMSLDEFDELPKLYDKMLKAWEEGNAKLLNEVSRLKILEAEEDLPGIKDYYNELFLKRDEKIVEKIVTFLEDKEENTYFIIVGAIHLVGEDGLLQMLKDKGYKVVQE
jgi:uncharacterized protein YbaP (TraB family)